MLHCFDTVHLRHHMVHENDIVIVGLTQGDGFRSGISCEHLNAVTLENTFCDHVVHRLIVYYQRPCAAAHKPALSVFSRRRVLIEQGSHRKAVERLWQYPYP